jgi:preprotein translocase subunit SecG
MTLFVEIIYLLVTFVLILVVLLQAGRGGGMGTALGGGASQSVFGGSGGADFLAKLTQGLAIGFMVCAVYLAYASAHTGSERLQQRSEEIAESEFVAEGDEQVRHVGPNPLRLPPADAAPEAPSSTVEAPTLEPVDEESAADEPVADEPAADEPAADEPAADEPAADEPAADEPAADEPAADDADVE